MKQKRVVRTALWCLLVVLGLTGSAVKIVKAVYEGDYQEAVEEMEKLPLPCDIAMNCDQKIDPMDEQEDQADV